MAASPASTADQRDARYDLGDMAAKRMTMPEVACRRCDRRGRLSIAPLIAEHGPVDYGDLRALIAADCPKLRRQHTTRRAFS
jgi:hypothetical protein